MTIEGPPPAIAWQRAASELVGTFALVFVGCGAIMVDELSGGRIGHPGVSIAVASIGAFPWREVPSYLIAQVAGALLAAGVLALIFGPAAHLGATAPSPSPSRWRW